MLAPFLPTDILPLIIFDNFKMLQRWTHVSRWADNLITHSRAALADKFTHPLVISTRPFAPTTLTLNMLPNGLRHGASTFVYDVNNNAFVAYYDFGILRKGIELHLMCLDTYYTVSPITIWPYAVSTTRAGIMLQSAAHYRDDASTTCAYIAYVDGYISVRVVDHYITNITVGREGRPQTVYPVIWPHLLPADPEAACEYVVENISAIVTAVGCRAEYIALSGITATYHSGIALTMPANWRIMWIPETA